MMETQGVGRHIFFTTKGTKPTKENPKEIGGVRRWDSLSCLSFVPLVTLVVNDFDLQFPCISMPRIDTKGIRRHVYFTTKGTKVDPKKGGRVRRWNSLSRLSFVPLVSLVVNDLDLQFRCASMRLIETQGIGTHALFTTKRTKATKENPKADDGGVGTAFLAFPSCPW